MCRHQSATSVNEWLAALAAFKMNENCRGCHNKSEKSIMQQQQQQQSTRVLLTGLGAPGVQSLTTTTKQLQRHNSRLGQANNNTQPHWSDSDTHRPHRCSASGKRGGDFRDTALLETRGEASSDWLVASVGVVWKNKQMRRYWWLLNFDVLVNKQV